MSIRAVRHVVALCLLGAVTAPAQWYSLPSKDTPRTAAGKPNMTAPMPLTAAGHPNLEGVWRTAAAQLHNAAADLKPDEVKFLPWAKKVFDARQDAGYDGKNDPAARCIQGMPKMNVLPYPFKIIDNPKEVIILYESFSTFRQIHLDGRELPKDPDPMWLGYSVGHWEKDALVAVTTGINDTTWIDNAGHPHTKDLKVTERYRRVDFGHMTIETTIDDPGAYAEPWTYVDHATLLPETELLEFICENNSEVLPHLVR